MLGQVGILRGTRPVVILQAYVVAADSLIQFTGFLVVAEGFGGVGGVGGRASASLMHVARVVAAKRVVEGAGLLVAL